MMPDARARALRNVPLVIGGALVGARFAYLLRRHGARAGDEAGQIPDPERAAAGTGGQPRWLPWPAARGWPAQAAEAGDFADPARPRAASGHDAGAATAPILQPAAWEAGAAAAGAMPAEAAPAASTSAEKVPAGREPVGAAAADARPAGTAPASATPVNAAPADSETAELQAAIERAKAEGWPDEAPAAARGVFAIAKQAVLAWFADGGPRLGASIAFYTMFAIAPIMLILLAIAGAVFGEEAARGQVMGQIEGLVGTDAAKGIQELLAAADKKEKQGAWGTVIGLGTALIGASAVFAEMKNAFDTIFKPQPAEEESVVTALVRTRLMSAALVLALGFLVVVSLLLSSAATAASQWVGSIMPFLQPVASLTDVVVSTTVLTVAFWALIRYLPERAPGPRAIWIGALTSALLFAVGKQLIGLYLARGAVASAYGAAGSIIVAVLWVYYSAQILLLGAEVARSIDDPAKAADKASQGREQLAQAAGKR